MNVDHETLAPVLPELIEAYRSEGNPTGGNLHIVIDDCNIEDAFIWFCQEQCLKENDLLGYLIGTLIRGIEEEERERMFDRGWAA